MRVSRRSLLISVAAPLVAQRTLPPRNNIVVILADRLGGWALGSYGNKEIRTPNLDLLARGGTIFANHAVCAPAPQASLATLVSGTAPRVHGVEEGEGAPASFAKLRWISDVLSTAGYACGFAGKWGLGDSAGPQHGFRFWRPEPGAAMRSAAEFLKEQKPGQPFLLLVSLAEPRAPYDGYPQKYYDLYAASRFEESGWMPMARNSTEGKEFLRDVVGSLRKSAAAVTALDNQVAPLIEILDERKLRDDTLCIFTAACGHLMGRHGLWGAGTASDPVNMYEESVMTPMIWNWPGKVPVEGRRPELIGGDDLFPSLCEVAGVTPPKGLLGTSYVRLALNRPLPRNQPWRNLVFSRLGNTVMARDLRYKLVLQEGGKTPGELYDMRADPRELNNLYEDLEFVTVRNALAAEIEKWMKQ